MSWEERAFDQLMASHGKIIRNHRGRIIYKLDNGKQLVVNSKGGLHHARNNLHLAANILDISKEKLDAMKNGKPLRSTGDSQKDFGLAAPKPKTLMEEKLSVVVNSGLKPEGFESKLSDSMNIQSLSKEDQIIAPNGVVAPPAPHPYTLEEIDIINHVRVNEGEKAAQEVMKGIREGTADLSKYQIVDIKEFVQPAPDQEPPIIKQLKEQIGRYQSETAKAEAESLQALATYEKAEDLLKALKKKLEASQNILETVEKQVKIYGQDMVADMFKGTLKPAAHHPTAKPPKRIMAYTGKAKKGKGGKHPKYDYVGLSLEVLKELRHGVALPMQELLDAVFDRHPELTNQLSPKLFRKYLYNAVHDVFHCPVERTSMGIRIRQGHRV